MIVFESHHCLPSNVWIVFGRKRKKKQEQLANDEGEVPVLHDDSEEDDDRDAMMRKINVETDMPPGEG